MVSFRVALIALAAVLVSPGSRGQVALVADEEFDYITGALNGRNGGTGWSTPWAWTYTSGASLAVVGSGLSYSGLSTGGGHATWSSGGNGLSEASRSLPLVNSGVVYVQFLGQFGATSGGGTPNLRFLANGTLTGGLGGNGGTYGEFVSILDTGLNAASNGSSSSSASLANLNLIVARIDYAANETRLWTNPNLATFDYGNPTGHNAIYTGLAPAFDTLMFITRSPGAIDEISIYTAVPEPATSAAAMALAAMVAFGARKRLRRRAG